jgi:hypothetical protein
MESVGARVLLRDADSLDDLRELTAPEPVEPGDLVATRDDVYRVVAVLLAPSGAPRVPVLARADSITDEQ